jgi:hypothetical protein
MWVIKLLIYVILIASVISWIIYGIWRLQHPGQKW